MTPTQDALRSWHDFFLLVGGASATLLGLVFVSVALVVNLPSLPDDEERSLFSSPIVAQLSYALGLSALAPWREARWLGVAVSAAGIGALVQSSWLTRAMRRRHLDRTRTDLGTWVTVAVAPLASACLCATAGVMLLASNLTGLVPFGVGIALLDLIALTNAWRLFIWILSQHQRRPPPPHPP